MLPVMRQQQLAVNKGKKMKHFETTLYPSANRFVLIDNFMVPFEFLEKMYDEVFGYCFRKDEVSCLQDNCSNEFWCSLTDIEQMVFGRCLLILIENGLERDFYRNISTETYKVI